MPVLERRRRRPTAPTGRVAGRRRRSAAATLAADRSCFADDVASRGPPHVHEFDERTDALTDEVIGYLRWRLELDPVDARPPGDGGRAASSWRPSLISEEGNDPSVVLRQFTDVLAHRVLSDRQPAVPVLHPRRARRRPACCSTRSCRPRRSTARRGWRRRARSTPRTRCCAFLADLAGLPEGAGGCFLSGGSAGNLSALVVARDVARARGLPSTCGPRILASDQAHSSVTNTARIIDADVVPVATTDDRLTGERGGRGPRRPIPTRPRSSRSSPPPAPPTPASSTTSRGVGEVAQAAGVWFHVDAAYGGAALLAPERPRAASTAWSSPTRSSSIPHKWLFAPFDCAALLYRRAARSPGGCTPRTPATSTRSTRRGAWNPTDYAYHLTRRARGLAIWFSLCTHGVAAYREAVEASLDLARWTAARIEELDHLELVREPDLSIVMFRRTGWDWERVRARGPTSCSRTAIGFVLPSRWHGRADPALRLPQPRHHRPWSTRSWRRSRSDELVVEVGRIDDVVRWWNRVNPTSPAISARRPAASRGCRGPCRPVRSTRTTCRSRPTNRVHHRQHRVACRFSAKSPVRADVLDQPACRRRRSGVTGWRRWCGRDGSCRGGSRR